MELAHIFDNIPIWLFFFIIVFISLLAFEVGYRIGVAFLNRTKGELKPPLEALAVALLGLLAFIMAFTFSLAAGRFDNRRELVIDEANAINTTFLRANYLEEPYRSKVKSLLQEYVTVRLEAINTKQYQEALERTSQIQRQLWDQVVLLVENGFDSESISLFIESMNDVINLHSKRSIFILGLRVPSVIWFVLLAITLLSMAMLGYFTSFKKSRVLVVNLILISAFALVIYLIIDLDHPQQGLLRVTQQPLINVLHTMKTY